MVKRAEQTKKAMAMHGLSRCALMVFCSSYHQCQAFVRLEGLAGSWAVCLHS